MMKAYLTESDIGNLLVYTNGESFKFLDGAGDGKVDIGAGYGRISLYPEKGETTEDVAKDLNSILTSLEREGNLNTYESMPGETPEISTWVDEQMRDLYIENLLNDTPINGRSFLIFSDDPIERETLWDKWQEVKESPQIDIIDTWADRDTTVPKDVALAVFGTEDLKNNYSIGFDNEKDKYIAKYNDFVFGGFSFEFNHQPTRDEVEAIAIDTVSEEIGILVEQAIDNPMLESTPEEIKAAKETLLKMEIVSNYSNGDALDLSKAVRLGYDLMNDGRYFVETVEMDGKPLRAENDPFLADFDNLPEAKEYAKSFSYTKECQVIDTWKDPYGEAPLYDSRHDRLTVSVNNEITGDGFRAFAHIYSDEINDIDKLLLLGLPEEYKGETKYRITNGLGDVVKTGKVEKEKLQKQEKLSGHDKLEKNKQIVKDRDAQKADAPTAEKKKETNLS